MDHFKDADEFEDEELVEEVLVATDQTSLELVQLQSAAIEDFYFMMAVYIRKWERYDFVREILDELAIRARDEELDQAWLKLQLQRLWEYATNI